MPDRPRFVLLIEDAGGDRPAPVEVRLRRLLKAMLRWFGLRCVEVRPDPTAGPAGHGGPKGRAVRI